jgi:hypothetical protein
MLVGDLEEAALRFYARRAEQQSPGRILKL